MPHNKPPFGELISDIVAHVAGSWKFIFIFAGFLVCWMILNGLAVFDVIAFDKPPYILLNLILSFLAAFQAPFIMSQNRAERKQDQAYRALFMEIKELVEQDIENEQEIHNLEREIKEELEIVKAQQARLLSTLQQAISLEKLTRKDIAEILEYCEE